MNEQTAIQKVVGNDSMLSVIERAARDPNVNVDKMEKLLSLAEQVHARQAKAEYDQAMNAAQGEMRPISKDCSNPQTRSRYASYEAIDTAIRPIYTTHGFAMSFGSRASANPASVIVTCRVSHRAGHTEMVELEMPADGKGPRGNEMQTRTHATGSALSYAKRYIANLVWNLSFGEMDDDGNAAGRRNAPQPAPLPSRTESPEDRRKRAFEELRKTFSEDQIFTFFDISFLDQWPLEKVPQTRGQFSALCSRIASGLSEKESEEVAPTVDILPPEIGSVIFHVPPKGVKKADYKTQTIGELWADRHTPDTARRLFGFLNAFEAKGWTKRNQDGTETQMPPSKEDVALRQGLDDLAQWMEQRGIKQE